MPKQAAMLSVQKFDFNPEVSVPVMEHFYTLQGEGYWNGIPSYFVRLAGCNVGCVWCDVKESWDATAQQLIGLDEIVTLVASSGCGRVVITGGEPAMYDLNALTMKLKNSGIKIHVETSGAYPLKGNFDWICLSPKKFLPPVPEIYAKANELKIIVFNEHDFKWAESEAEKCNPGFTRLYLQAEWEKRNEFYPKIVSYLKANPKWRLSIQSHKYVQIP